MKKYVQLAKKWLETGDYGWRKDKPVSEWSTRCASMRPPLQEMREAAQLPPSMDSFFSLYKSVDSGGCSREPESRFFVMWNKEPFDARAGFANFGGPEKDGTVVREGYLFFPIDRTSRYSQGLWVVSPCSTVNSILSQLTSYTSLVQDLFLAVYHANGVVFLRKA